jgi:hypothetical protein
MSMPNHPARESWRVYLMAWSGVPGSCAKNHRNTLGVASQCGRGGELAGEIVRQSLQPVLAI